MIAVWKPLAASLLLASLPAASEGLQVGHWIEVRGELDGDTFRAERVEVLEPERYELLIGTVTVDDAEGERFVLLGQPVTTSDKTEWEDGLEHGSLLGARVKVEGHWHGPGKLSSREVSPRGSGRERIGGRVDEIERDADGGYVLRVMRFRVVVPPDVELEHELPWEALPLAAPRRVSALQEVEGVYDYDDLFGGGFELLPGLTLEGQVELRSTTEDNFNLDDTDHEDRVDRTAGVRTRLVWRISDDVEAFSEQRFNWRWRNDEDDGRSTDRDGSLGQTYVWIDDVLGLDDVALVVGRQDFDDPREWLYDENLDAVRVVWEASSFELEVSASTVLADGDDRDLASHNWIAYLSNGDRDRHLAGWSVYRDIDLPGLDREKSLHVGTRALGEWLPDVELWLDTAYQYGERGGRRVQAWAYDVGATWKPAFAGDVAFTAGYALGSGGGGASGTDRTFRQTGFQDNNGLFDGVTSFRYYGELAEPELSNIGIATLGIGGELWEDTSLDLVWHDYLQDEAVDRIVDSEIDVDPSGLDADIGQELDLIFGWRRVQGWDVEIVGAHFEPGAAFPGADDAWLLKLQLRYRF